MASCGYWTLPHHDTAVWDLNAVLLHGYHSQWLVRPGLTCIGNVGGGKSPKARTFARRARRGPSLCTSFLCHQFELGETPLSRLYSAPRQRAPRQCTSGPLCQTGGAR